MRDISALHSGWIIGAAALALAIPLSFAPAAHAAVDCGKSPTYLKPMPGGHELVFYPECEPPPLASAKPAAPVAWAGAPAPGIIPVANAPEAAGESAEQKAQSKRGAAPRIRVQKFSRRR